MTYGAIALLIIGIIVVLAGIVFCIYMANEDEFGTGLTVLIVALVFGGLMIAGPIIYSNTERGKRALKDQKSNFANGIERIVRVFDVNGELIEEYEGKFDVETGNADYILFDDENGKRHIIYYTTGTIIIDEK